MGYWGIITHIVYTRDSALMFLLSSCDNRHITNKVYCSDPSNIQNHARKTELPVLTTIIHAGEQDYTS